MEYPPAALQSILIFNPYDGSEYVAGLTVIPDPFTQNFPNTLFSVIVCHELFPSRYALLRSIIATDAAVQ